MKNSFESGVFDTKVDKNGFPEKPSMTFSKFLEEINSGTTKQAMDKLVLINGKPIDHISFKKSGVDFVGGEFSEKLPVGSKKSDDIFDAPLDKNGFPKKQLMTFGELLESLKTGNPKEAMDNLVLIDGQPIDRISFEEAGVNFFGKTEKE